MSASGNLLTDHPELYEAQFPDPDRIAGRWAEHVLRRHGAGDRVLDAGCGTGRDIAYLQAQGRDTLGIDMAGTMLTYARAHHPGPEYHRADLRGFELDRTVDAVLCLDSSLLYCHSNEELAGFLGSCRRHLAPGGLLVAELRNGAYFLGAGEGLGVPHTRTLTWQGVTHTSTTTLHIDRAAQLLRRRRVWTTGESGRSPVEQHSAWRLLFPQELRHLLAHAGFDVLELHDGPGPRTDPPWRPGAPEPAGCADGDRLHLVARLAR
ncbi:class I SAM-dependent DNA methyltransferase [Streptomyces sp. NPDC048639]|uniref:class I SAM-dependent DNA methyltransferase n=1 Tax=Streptomyces sp. NPDC048639 TaxID=3365581 RepID=UPI00371D733C